ncbi:MAG: glutathione S-transferase family protein [Rhodospirillaceae bacterium]
MKLDYYYAPRTCALVSYVNLTEAGAEFDVHVIDWATGQRFSPEYLKINPKHKVPALVIDGKPLTENAAISVWINQNYPDAKILPSDPMDYAKAISVQAWCASGIHPHLSRINSPHKFAGEGSEDDVKRLGAEFIHENLAVGDDMLAGREYFFDHYTGADAHFFWCCRRATQLGPQLDDYPNVTAHFNRMLERDSVKKVLAYEAEVLAERAKAS